MKQQQFDEPKMLKLRVWEPMELEISDVSVYGRTPANQLMWRISHLGGGFKYFFFLPLPGEMIHFD